MKSTEYDSLDAAFQAAREAEEFVYSTEGHGAFANASLQTTSLQTALANASLQTTFEQMKNELAQMNMRPPTGATAAAPAAPGSSDVPSQNDQRQSGSQKSRRKPKCYRCEEIGHVARFCRTILPNDFVPKSHNSVQSSVGVEQKPAAPSVKSQLSEITAALAEQMKLTAALTDQMRLQSEQRDRSRERRYSRERQNSRDRRSSRDKSPRRSDRRSVSPHQRSVEFSSRAKNE